MSNTIIYLGKYFKKNSMCRYGSNLFITWKPKHFNSSDIKYLCNNKMNKVILSVNRWDYNKINYTSKQYFKKLNIYKNELNLS